VTEVAEFLLSRLADDEMVALVAARGDEVFGPLAQYADDEYDPRLLHAQRWRPDRIRIEIETRKHIVQIHSTEAHRCPGVDDSRPEPTGCPTLRLLALTYADHPQYRDEWRP
jgi:hypothetical protein